MNIVVTGASSGIGYQTVLEFASNPNNTIIAVARRGDRLDSLRERGHSLYGYNSIVPVVADLEFISDIELFNIVSSFIGSVDILLNNAAQLIKRPFIEFSDSDLYSLFSINVFSIFKVTRALYPLLIKSCSPHIVNISSMGGVIGSAKFCGLSAYSSSKGSVSVLTECMAEEFRHINIKVNALAFGAIQTDMLALAFPDSRPDVTDYDIAKLVALFCIDGHRFFNGMVVPVSNSNP